MPEQQDKFDSWAIVEVMGHRKLAGKVTEQALAGVNMLRVDVPEVPAGEQWGSPVPAIPAFTQFLGGSSIFAITPCSEDAARATLARMRTSPPIAVDVRPALPVPTSISDDDYEEEEVDEYAGGSGLEGDDATDAVGGRVPEESKREERIYQMEQMLSTPPDSTPGDGLCTMRRE